MRKLLLLIVILSLLASCEEESDPKFEVISFNSWDMTSEFNKIIENPIISKDIIEYYAMIYTDFGENYSDVINISSFNDIIQDYNGSISMDGSGFHLEINQAGLFNSPYFDDSEQRRGYIVVKYK